MPSLPQVMTYVINLDRSPQRMAIMEERLKPLDLAWTRVSAVEGKQLDLPNLRELSIPGFLANHGKQPKPAEVGCYLSHIRVFEAFLAQHDAEFALVLEDDVLFQDDFLEVLQALTQCASAWDLVRLSGFHSGGPVGIQALTERRQLAIMFFKQTSSAAYLINRKAAQAMLNSLLPMTVPYDHAFDQPWAMGVKARMVSPLPISLDWEQESTIGYAPGTSGKLKWYRRFSTYRYRLCNECRRAVNSTSEWLAHQLKF
jgi:glycosyl transferase, family 25